MIKPLSFSKSRSIQDTDIQESFGVRGAALNELAALSLPIAPGFMMDSESFLNLNFADLPAFLKQGIAQIELGINKKLNQTEGLPLTLKVVLSPSLQINTNSVHNIGLNDLILPNLAKHCGEEFVYTEYKSLILEFGVRFLGLTKSKLKEFDQQHNISNLPLPKQCEMYSQQLVKGFPQDPIDQLCLCIEAMQTRYLADPLNKGVSCGLVVQMICLGNLSQNSGSGSCFSRDTITGENKLSGMYAVNEFQALPDNSQPIDSVGNKYKKELEFVASTLESRFLNICKINFVIEEGNLWLLNQFKATEVSTTAEMRLLLEFRKAEKISDAELIFSIPPSQLHSLLHPTVDRKISKNLETVTGGLSGSPGACSGKVYFNTARLIEAYQTNKATGNNDKFILAMKSTYANDVQAIELGEGVISSEGGYASHAPVVARSLGKPALIHTEIRFEEKAMTIDGVRFTEGEQISMEVSAYSDPVIYRGEIALSHPDTQKNGLEEFLACVSNYTVDFKVRANADNAKDAKLARKLGARGVGLCRTEHMFFEADRIMVFREMLFSDTKEMRMNALKKLQKFQTKDFIDMFEAMEGEVVTIRLLDAPLHEFTPNKPDDLQNTIRHLNDAGLKTTEEEVQQRIDRLHEVNPMLGHRGCRVAISHPEIYHMQLEAIFLAAHQVATKSNIPVKPEIMIPIVMNDEEVKFIKNGRTIEGEEIAGIAGVERKLLKQLGISRFPFEFKIGVMIELPAAALSAGHIAKQAEFFSFGTNDLTQTVHGVSRDDINSFLPAYTHYDLVGDNPFQILTNPVKNLISFAVRFGRVVRPDLKVGLCGEHGAEPRNIKFCMDSGLDYVSCSPYGVPLAALAIAQMHLKKQQKAKTS